MGTKYLIDTNVLLEFVGDLLPEKAVFLINDIIAEEFNISVINYIEVLGHSSATKEVSDFLNISTLFQLTPEIVNQTISIRKVRRIKLPDAIIAATAIIHNLILLSRNTKDFINIQGLEVLNPYDI